MVHKACCRFQKLLLCLAVIGMPVMLFAGTTGKISGVIRDKGNREPLSAANVVIEGTTLGGATNSQGYYFILNVPPGIYKVKTTFVGYNPVVVENVKVSVDLTTKVDFSLASTVLEMGETVVVAERPLIDAEVTNKRFTVSAEQIRDMPIADVRQIITLQSGVTEIMGYQNQIAGFGSRGIDQVHVRGGRNGQIAYMIDGMYVEDAIYAGMGTSINKDAIDELSLIVGGFDAEYGQAQAGVVNIVTKEGGTSYRGSFEASSGEILGYLGSKRDDVRDYHDAIASFGGPVPGLKNTSFFFSGEQSFSRYAFYEFDDITYDTTCVDRDPATGNCRTRAGDLRRDFVAGVNRKPWKAASTASGSTLLAWDNLAGWEAFGFNQKWDGLGKLTFRPSAGMNLSLSYHRNDRRFRYYEFGFQFIGNGIHVVKDQSEQLGLIWKHTLSASTFYELRGNHFWKHRTFRVHGIDEHELARDEYPSDQTEVEDFGVPLRFIGYDTTLDASGNLRLRHLYRGRTTQYWTRNFVEDYELSLNLTSQINPQHQIKTGLEYKTFGVPQVLGLEKTNGIVFDEEQFPWSTNPSVDKYNYQPVEASFFLQDKMEFEHLIVNAGFRIDYANSGGGTWRDPTNPTSGFTVGKKKTQASPRLGIGYPLTENTAFHFSYGHFFQVPEYRNLYRGTTLDPVIQDDRVRRGSVGIYGNPHLDAQKTVAYEIGLEQQIGEQWALDLTLWYKENSGDAGSINIIGFDPDTLGLYDYYVFTNYDYGSGKGIDVSIEKRFSSYYFGVVNYTYSVAKANRYYSWSGYWNSQNAANEPKREFLAAYDQPHMLNVNGVVNFPSNFGPSLLGWKLLADFNANLIFRVASGYPYTPRQGSQDLEPNSGRRPYTMTLDAVLRKDFKITSTVKAGLFARIYNVFDRKNPISVYRETGSPTDPGPTASLTRSSTYYDRPHNFGPRRSTDIGLKLVF